MNCLIGLVKTACCNKNREVCVKNIFGLVLVIKLHIVSDIGIVMLLGYTHIIKA